MVTLLGFELASLLSGAAFVEILFSWPGLGQMMLEALLGNDWELGSRWIGNKLCYVTTW